jgi:antitoxin YefM
MFSYEIISPIEARNSLFQILEEVVTNHQVFLINRREGENVALIAESDLTGLQNIFAVNRTKNLAE